MESIKDKVAIVGMGCTQFGEHWDKDPYDLMIDACYEAFEDAGIEPKDIQQAYFASLVSGCTGARLASALKLEYIPITRVESFCSGGAHALANACYAVLSGVCDIALACGVEKLKDRSTGFATTSIYPFDSSKVLPEFPPVNDYARIATRYFHNRGWSFDEGRRVLGMISVKNHHNGSLNPKAHLRRKISLEDALNAPMVCYPLGFYDCCGISDGSAAAIVTRTDNAKNFRDDYILVKAIAMASGADQALLQDDFDWVHFPENIAASKRAFQQAGIKNPREEISLVQCHDCFTIHELLVYEDMGFSPRGRAREDIEAGTFTLEGKIPFNTDGGLKCFGHPLSATGLRQMYETYKQLQGKAGQRQVKSAKLGLTHVAGGMYGKLNAVVTILGRRD